MIGTSHQQKGFSDAIKFDTEECEDIVIIVCVRSRPEQLTEAF